MRIALITGAGGGLGLATVKRMASDGLTVAVADLELARAREVAEFLPDTGHLALRIDVADEQSVGLAFDAVEAELGPVSVLACFAGIANAHGTSKLLSIAEMGVDEWNRVMRVNALGSFLCIREMMRRRVLRPVEHGRIVTVSSLAGQLGSIGAGAAYGVSKGAILSLTKVAAGETASLGITVNAIAPGPIDTPMLHLVAGGKGNEGAKRITDKVPLRRAGLPEEIAAAVAYLISPNAAYVTGATIDVNGGMYMR